MKTGIERAEGFTLIELLLAISIYSVIAVGLYSALNAGLRLWKKGDVQMEENQMRRVFFTALSRDLRNAFPFSKQMPFVGNAHKLSFMALVDTGEGGRTEIVQITYELDEDTGNVTRSVAAAPGVRMAEGLPTPLTFSFSYKEDESEEKIDWEDQWQDEEKIPKAVKLTAGPWERAMWVPLGEWKKPGD